MLEQSDLNSEEQGVLNELKKQFGSYQWKSLLEHRVWKEFISPKIPQFLYFDDYYLLPGKINLPRIKMLIDENTPLENEDKTVLGLLRMAGVDLNALTDTSGYENIKAKLEAISNAITDKVFEYWTQNQELDVEFDIRPDPSDEPPYNNGNNLYIRIRNRRHRVTVPFSQRSKGFIWFFSFIVWFDSIKLQLETDNDLILLLDEPGLSLHALAQNDFLRYIDFLAEEHQIIYTTHSPFMVHSDRLHQVRTVEDRIKEGTKISENVSGSDPKTIFPLQAALGYTIAQNLFISKRNLLVEGPSDLIYLRHFSLELNKASRTSLRDDVTVVPAGGLDNLATFIALLRGNELEIVVIHDYENKPPARLEGLIRAKLIRDKQIMNYAEFRDVSDKVKTAGTSLLNSDVEDLISPASYLMLFSKAYEKELGGTTITEAMLPPGDRIIERIKRYLSDNSLEVRPSGGFNHYHVANYLALNPKAIKVDVQTLSRFEHLFAAINNQFQAI